MRNLIIFICLGCLAFNTTYAYISSSSEQPKMYHNQPGSSDVTDEDVENKINDILKTQFQPYEIGDVAFSVTNGKVTLTGTVETLANKRKIEALIKRIDAVNNIDNQIEVVKTSP